MDKVSSKAKRFVVMPSFPPMQRQGRRKQPPQKASRFPLDAMVFNSENGCFDAGFENEANRRSHRCRKRNHAITEGRADDFVSDRRWLLDV